ncbi:MAG: DUF1501 domain-containing protein [Deltaproteobacteria bacterium]|nr:MAG: DUF1501 domain-containing protein [Deltaproteobacteria bacterium]
MTKGLTRRGFLGLGAGAAVALGAPWVWKRRKVSAAPIVQSPLSTGAIFFVLNGGARTQAVFNGTVGSGTNPFGQISGLPVPLSAVMQGTGLDNPDINAKLNFVSTCQHHNRTGNHGTGRTVACTGYEPQENKPGILTLVNASFAFRDIPCVNIGNDTPTTIVGSEISSTFSPIKISSPLNVQDITSALVSTAVSDNETARLERLRYTLSDRFHRGTKYKEPEDIPFFQRKAVDIAQQLNNDALDIRTNASMGRYVDGTNVSNGALRASFGVNNNGGGNDLGAKAMLAVRLRQLGCAGITISSGQNWDLHSNEDDGLPPRAFALGQAIAGLIDHLGRIPDPYANGLTLLDTTVITVLTDFNRGNWAVGTGFNGNQGSDHRTGEDKTAMQCIPIIGGGLPGGAFLGEVGGDGSPVGASPVYETRQVLATVLDLMGVPTDTYFPGIRPITEDLLA